MLVFAGLTLCFKVPWRPLLTASLVILSLIPILFALSSSTAFISWVLNPGIYGETASFTVDECRPDSTSYICVGTMQISNQDSFQSYIYSDTNHGHLEQVEGASYSDPMRGSGYFQPAGTAPRLNPGYAVGSSIAIAAPVLFLILLRNYHKTRGIKGWFWSIEESALNIPAVQIGLQILGLLLFTVGIVIFSTFIISDLNATPNTRLEQTKLFEMSAGDYLTISGIGFALLSAVEGLTTKRQGILRKLSRRARLFASKAIWIISLYVSMLALLMIAMRLSNPTRHNLIPVLTRDELKGNVGDLAILEDAFSWQNLLAILALAITIMLLTFTEYKRIRSSASREVGDKRGREQVEHAMEAFFLVFIDKFAPVELSELYRRTNGGQSTARLLIKMKLVSESGKGTVKPTNLGRELIEH